MPYGTLLFLLLFAPQQAQYGKPNIPTVGSHQHTQTTCPWLTQGSASNLLGGDVAMKVSVSVTGQGSCRFVRSDDTLEILVSKAALAVCPRGSTELKGIGNQAATCKASGRGYVVSGRVRDFHFTVTQIARGKKSSVEQDALQQIAEQVAGNLY
jgi:hypothetical protein